MDATEVEVRGFKRIGIGRGCVQYSFLVVFELPMNLWRLVCVGFF